mmetsp:Transcript_32216/g.75047  ORF Transcript_32216/g.75047 Transcript_32216/m.75047 type:complete len:404 (-) Transcript_32216:91-1302(-)
MTIPLGTRGAWNCGSRIWLFVFNGASLILSIMLLVYGSVAMQRMGNAKSVVTAPFALAIAMGSLIMVASLCGLGGACCAVSNDDGTPGKLRKWANRALFIYYFIILFTCCGLFFGMLLCFVWSDYTDGLVTGIWNEINKEMNGGADKSETMRVMLHNSVAAGIVCLLLFLLNVLSAHCAATLMGYKYTSRKTVMIINVMGFVLGLMLTILGFAPAPSEVGVNNAWLPDMIGAIGICLMVFALVGFYAAARLNQVLLLVNAACVGIFAVLLLGFGIFCLADAKAAASIVTENWEQIKVRFIDLCPACDKEELGEKGFETCCTDNASAHVFLNLSVLGIACITTLTLLVCNLAGSYYLWRQLRQNISEEIEKGTVSGLQGGDDNFEGPAANRARQYRMNDPSDDL